MRFLTLCLTALPLVSSLEAGRDMLKLRLKYGQTGDVEKRDTDPALLYPAHNISVPVDHFHNISTYAPHTNATFPLRYFFDASYYQPGGPVIILQSGETSAEDRLPYLQKGLLQQLAQATHGIGVVLEHRYYGTSFPTPDLSTKNLRFLTTEQALADEAYFAQHIVFPGLEDKNLTSKDAAYIGYGGSYAGAFNAFLRVQYPQIFWGTISSSGVTKAIWDYWEYFYPIGKYGPPGCIEAQKNLVSVIDNILIGKNSSSLTTQLKTAFGLQNVTYDDDFANTVTTNAGIYTWQSLNWDPAVTSNDFYDWCGNISSTQIEWPNTASLNGTAASLIQAAGYSANSTLVNQMLNLIGYVNYTEVSSCTQSGMTQDECFSQRNPTYYAQDDISQQWRSWPYQYCTQWGYLQTGSGFPANEQALVSRLVDLEYNSLICNYAFDIYTPPDTDAINKYGGYNISYPRLAIVGGEWDPWRPATPQAWEFGARNRTSTIDQPDLLIPQAVHHWDEDGLFPNQTTSTLPPQTIKTVQSQEKQFVLAWMKEWQEHRLTYGRRR